MQGRNIFYWFSSDYSVWMELLWEFYSLLREKGGEEERKKDSALMQVFSTLICPHKPFYDVCLLKKVHAARTETPLFACLGSSAAYTLR